MSHPVASALPSRETQRQNNARTFRIHVSSAHAAMRLGYRQTLITTEDLALSVLTRFRPFSRSRGLSRRRSRVRVRSLSLSQPVYPCGMARPAPFRAARGITFRCRSGWRSCRHEPGFCRHALSPARFTRKEEPAVSSGFLWSRRADSNRGPLHYEGSAPWYAWGLSGTTMLCSVGSSSSRCPLMTPVSRASVDTV